MGDTGRAAYLQWAFFGDPKGKGFEAVGRLETLDFGGSNKRDLGFILFNFKPQSENEHRPGRLFRIGPGSGAGKGWEP